MQSFSIWLKFKCTKSADRRLARKALLHELQEALNGTITPQGPSHNSFQVFGKVSIKLNYHFSLLEKIKWKTIEKKLESFNKHKPGELDLRQQLEEFGQICDKCYTFLFKVTTRLEKKWEAL